MYIKDLNRERRLKNKDKLNSEKTKLVNNFFDEIYEQLSIAYESIMDNETEVSDWEIIIKEKASV